MTTFKHFTFESAIVSRREFRISLGVLIFTILSCSTIHSQSNSDQRGKESYKYTQSERSHESATSNPILLNETGLRENRIEEDLAIDHERNDGIDMFLSGTNYRGSSIISCQVEYLQAGHTVIKIQNAVSGEILKSLFDGPTTKGIQKFEIDTKDFDVQDILIVATHKTSVGQMIISTLQFDESRTEDIPLGYSKTEIIEVDAQLSPTLGRGFFQIQAEFKMNGTASVKVYDLNGRLIETLFSGNVREGSLTFEGNSSNWKTGNYIVCIHTDKGSWIRKMIVH